MGGATDPKEVNKWAGRIVPTILAGVVGYATYVFVALLCVDYLLKGERPRPGIAGALLAIYFVLFLFMNITYGRLLYIVTTDPGYLPLGPAAKKFNRNAKRSRSKKPANNRTDETLGHEYTSSETAIERDENVDSPGLELFYTKEIFVCTQDGRPRWCSECANWKPDRTHHCSDVGRCVYKMDHYCPWVGGVVGENSFKFFIQFVAYACLFCVFVATVMGIFLREQIASTSGHWDRQFIAVIALSGFFGLFTLGMTCSSLQFVFSNLTTIENLSKKRRPWILAVLIPPSFSFPSEGYHPHITYPLPLPPSKTKEVDSPVPSSNHSTPHNDVQAEPEIPTQRDAKATRTFAILSLALGRSPWDLGIVENWKSVMGNNFVDWILPVKRSPSCNHESDESHFETGRWVEQLKVDMGFMSEQDMRKPRPLYGRKQEFNTSTRAEMKGPKPAMIAEAIPRISP